MTGVEVIWIRLFRPPPPAQLLRGVGPHPALRKATASGGGSGGTAAVAAPRRVRRRPGGGAWRPRVGRLHRVADGAGGGRHVPPPAPTDSARINEYLTRAPQGAAQIDWEMLAHMQGHRFLF